MREAPHVFHTIKLSNALEVAVLVEVRAWPEPALKVIPVEGQLLVRHPLALVHHAAKVANGIADRRTQIGIARLVWVLSQQNLELEPALITGANDTQGDPVAGLATGDGITKRLSAGEWLTFKGHDQIALLQAGLLSRAALGHRDDNDAGSTEVATKGHR